MKKLALNLLVLLLLAPAAMALPIQATEVIEDLPPYDIGVRDLRRTISDSTGFSSVINSDPSIVITNNVNSNFGIYNNDDVSFRHNLTWLNPAAGSFLSAILQIDAFGVDGGNDVVLAETFNLGALNNDGSILENFSSTVFGSFSPVTLNTIFADGFLDIFIDKNAGANILGRFDSLSIYRSTLTVRYEAVPEPATMLLLGSGLLGVAARRRKRA